jgi:predicted type IV restriction endonuclease
MGTDFIDRIGDISEKIHKGYETVQTEEATKNAFIMPFIAALGYDVFDPGEVVPEFTADVGIKKGEKVDYAIMVDGIPVMLFECKWCGQDLDDTNVSQLIRYFNATQAKIGVLTNGIIYRFFTDLEEQNKMDSKSFLEFDMLDIEESRVAELKQLTKTSFNIDEMLSAAGDLKYTKEIKKLLSEQLESPDEELIRLFASRVYSGRRTQQVIEQFTAITRRAFQQFVQEQLSRRLKNALANESQDQSDANHETVETTDAEPDKKKRVLSAIETTEEELEGYHICKSILRQEIDPARIAYRDHHRFFNVLLDDSIRKPVLRLHFNGTPRKIGLLDANKQEQLVEIDNLNDIYQYAEQIRETALAYDQQ